MCLGLEKKQTPLAATFQVRHALSIQRRVLVDGCICLCLAMGGKIPSSTDTDSPSSVLRGLALVHDSFDSAVVYVCVGRSERVARGQQRSIVYRDTVEPFLERLFSR